MSNAKNLKTFFKGSIVLVISNVFLKAINFLLLPLYTNNLTPQMMGVSDTVTSFTGLLFPLLTMGLDSAYSAFYFESEDKERAKKVFNTILFMLGIVAMIPLVACFFSKGLSVLLFGQEENNIVMILALITVSLNMLFLAFALEIRMQNRMTIYGIVTLVASLSMILLNIYFVSILKIGVYALVLSTAIVYALQLVLFKIFSGKRFSFKFVDKHLLKQMLKFSLPLVPTVVATWILNLSDRYVILHFLGEEQVGIYGIGGRFVTLVNVVISAVSMAYTTFAYSNVENPDAKKQYATVLNLMYVLLAGIAFIISMFSQEIIQIMTTEAYAEAYRPMRDMMFAQVIYAMSTITSYGIYFKKKSSYALISTSIAAMINLILNFVFIPKYGIAAAAATTLLGYIVMFAINYIVSQKLYPCNYGMKLISVNMIGLYILLLVFAESNVTLKVIITVLAAIVTLVMFAKRLKEIFVSLRR